MNSAPIGGAAPRRMMITVSIMMASLMQVLDTTIANVALPHIQGAISATQDQIAWVLTAYIVASAIMTPLAGWLAGRVGRKRVLLASIIGFTLSSMFCGLAQTLPQLIVGRLLQGACGAPIIPMGQAVVLDINPSHRHMRAMAIWSMTITVGPIAGPAVGGWLTESYNWRWVFFINVPIGIVAFLGMWKYIRPDQGRRVMRFDVFGFATLSLAIGALQMLLDRGQQNDWFSSTETWVETIACIVAATYFVAHTLLTPAQRSFVDYRMLKNRNYVTGLFFIFIVGLVLYATRALTPTMLESLLDYPVSTTGFVTAPAGFGTMFAMLIAGRIIGKVDLRLTLLVGFLVTASALWQMTGYSLDLSESDIVWPGVLQGIGTGLVFVPLSAATFATLAPQMRPQGTSLFSLVRNIGSSIGISLVQTLLTRNTVIAHAAIVERVTSASSAWNNPAVAAAFDVRTPVGAAFLDSAVTRQAAMIAYIDDFWFMLLLTVLVIPLLLLIKPPGRNANLTEEPTALID
jgi:DHA2 family multidrug resistance protein